MISDDIIYVGLLLVSIAFGKITRQIPNTPVRKWTSSLFGLGIVVLVSGWSTLHPLFSVVIHSVLIKTVPKSKVHWINFVVGFAHLFFFRLCGSGNGWLWSAFPLPPSHTNAIQMIMTLKLMGLAFEVHETHKTELEKKYKHVYPNVLDIFHYAFSHAGILTGPYYRFRTFQDLYETPYAKYAYCTADMLIRLSRVPIYVILFLFSGYLFPLDAVKNEDFYETSSFIWRIFYMTPVFFNFRMRLYTGFILSECACIMAGLGAYPVKSDPKPGQGPSNLEALEDVTEVDEMNFETVHNIDEFAAESVTTMREALKSWNMTVQWWLVANVYRRLPGLSRGLRTVAVMVTSSAWHGVYFGYYLSLGSVPLVLAVEDLYEKILRRKISNTQVYDFIAWFMRFQWFSYLGMAFQLLTVTATMTFWHSIMYVGHVILPIFYILGILIVNPVSKIVWKNVQKQE